MKKLYAKIFAMLALAFSLSNLAFGQELEISGKVTDAKDGSGLPGVNILLVGTSSGAVSDINGSFQIKASSGSKLEFRFLGYTTVTKTIGAETTINVSMEEEVKNLKEAVVIGYGTVKKKDLTGSVTSIGSKDFQKGFQPTVDQLIAGKAAGVSIVSNGGSPGAGSTIRIRGGTSLNASNDPLIVIDGVPVDNNGLAGSPNPLSMINPNDIENITILKDASAAAIYGSRAANGVILITTKRGGPGKLNISASTQNSIQQMNRFVKVLSGQEFRDYVKANIQGSSRALLDTTSTTSTDWQKEIYRLAITSDNNLSLSGTLTTKWINLPYRVSGGYLTQQSVLKTGKMDRYSAGVNVSPTFFDNKLKIDLNFKGSLSNNQFADQGAIGSAITYDPTKPVRSENANAYGGYYEWVDKKGELIALSPRNPMALLELRDDKSEVVRYLGNAQIDYRFHFLPDLRININTGFDAGEGKGTNFIDPRSASVFVRGGTNNQYRERKFQYLNETYLNYTKEIGAIKSRIDITVGHSFQHFKTYQYAFPDVNVTKDSIVNPAPRLGSPPLNVIESYFGRLNYAFNSKYLLTATIRRDGSSRFAPDYRWGLFPSTAFAWKINEESFLKNVKAISNLKLRVGYGVTGQQDVNADYGYFGVYQLSGPTGNYQLGDTSFYRYYRPRAYQGDLRWEQTASYNAGVDFGILDERFTGTIDVFYRKTSDLLNFTNIPVGSNFTNAIIANVGDMTSKGIELTLSAAIIKKQDFTWDASFNVTHFQNKITKLTIDNDTSYQGAPVGGIAGATGNTIQINSIGYSPQTFYVYEQVYRDGKPVFNEYVDQNGDGQITDLDKIRFKSPVPKAIFGFSSSATYKKLTFGIVLRASVGGYMYNNVASRLGNQAAIAPGFPFLNNASTDILNTNFPKNQAFSSYYVQNVSFLRCDNINIGYSLGDLIHPKLNVNINANIQNAFLVTKYKGIEPEISGGIDNNFFARPRVFVLGLTVGFNK